MKRDRAFLYASASAPLEGDRGAAAPLTVGLWLAVVLIGAKAVLLGLPSSAQWFITLLAASFRDVVFAVAIGLLGELVLRASTKPRTRRLLRGLFLSVCVFCAFYAVVAVGVFEYFNRPLTYDLLHLARTMGPVRSSIGEQLTAKIATALIGIPLGLLAASLWNGWRRRLPRHILVAPMLWISAGWVMHAARPDLPGTRLELNPHIELARSTIAGLRGVQRVEFPKDFPPEDELEFRSFGARKSAGEIRPVNNTAASGLAALSEASATRPRNVIFLVLESTGTKYLSLYGSPYDTTPNLVAESKNALVLEDCDAQAPYTFHSFTALNFSIYPGLPWCHAPWAGRPRPRTLASLLQARGARTAYFHSGDLNWGSSRWLLEGHGFDTIEDCQELGGRKLTSWGTEDRALFDRLIRWVDEKPGEPFFALCWTDQTHDPYRLGPHLPPHDFFRGNPPPHLADELTRYLTIVRSADEQIGRLLTALRERGLADDTLVVITGDHGEAFEDPHPHRGHSLYINQEDINVPLVLWNPRLFPSGRRVKEVCGHVDINPTIADLIGVEPVADWQGHSLFEPGRPRRAVSVTGVGDYLFGLRDGSWKYIFNASDGSEQLFDLSRDREELQSIAATEREHCARMRQRIAAWVNFEEAFLRGHRD